MTQFLLFESLKIKDTLVNLCFLRFSEICSMLGGMKNHAFFVREMKSSKTLKKTSLTTYDTRFCCFESLKIKDTLVNFCFWRFSEICSMLGGMKNRAFFP